MLAGAGVRAQCQVSRVILGEVATPPSLRDYAQLCRFLSHKMTPPGQRVPMPQQYGSCGESQGLKGPQRNKEQTLHWSL